MLQRQFVQNFRIVTPNLASGSRIESDDVLVWRAEKKSVANFQRCDFERLSGGVAGLSSHISRVIGPGDLQVRDVGRRNLSQWGIALAEGRSSIGMPLPRLDALCVIRPVYVCS